MDPSISIDDLPQQFSGLSLRQVLLVLDEAGEVTTIAKLSDNAGMGFEGNDFM